MWIRAVFFIKSKTTKQRGEEHLRLSIAFWSLISIEEFVIVSNYPLSFHKLNICSLSSTCCLRSHLSNSIFCVFILNFIFYMFFILLFLQVSSFNFCTILVNNTLILWQNICICWCIIKGDANVSAYFSKTINQNVNTFIFL